MQATATASMSRQQDNAKIAEWLGWTYFKEEIGFECLYWVGLQPGCKERRPIPDFYTDEAANAMVLDKLLNTVVSDSDMPTHFKWAWQYVAKLIMEQITYHQNNDRKAAICAAALKLIEGEK